MSDAGSDEEIGNLDDTACMLGQQGAIAYSPQQNQGCFNALQSKLCWSEGYLTAVIFINIFCLFDTFDNINLKMG